MTHSYQADHLVSSVNDIKWELKGVHNEISLLRSENHSARMNGYNTRRDHDFWLLFLVVLHAIFMTILLVAVSHKRDRSSDAPQKPAVEAKAPLPEKIP